MKICQMNDCDWMIGESLEACKVEYGTSYADAECIDADAHELTDGEMDTLKFSDRSDDDRGKSRTFREQLAIDIAQGGFFPRMFASTEY